MSKSLSVISSFRVSVFSSSYSSSSSFSMELELLLLIFLVNFEFFISPKEDLEIFLFFFLLLFRNSCLQGESFLFLLNHDNNYLRMVIWLKFLKERHRIMKEMRKELFLSFYYKGLIFKGSLSARDCRGWFWTESVVSVTGLKIVLKRFLGYLGLA